MEFLIDRLDDQTYSAGMKSKLLSFVTNQDGDQVFVHVDKNGLDLLISELMWLKSKLEQGECEHTHLLSPDWGGDELTTSKLKDQQSEKNLVHEVKIYGWNDEWKKTHGLVK